MTDRYGEESSITSDQEELVGESASDLDDEITDVDEMQFTFCKPSNSSNLQNENNIDQTTSVGINDNCDSTGSHGSTDPNLKSKTALFGTGFTLLFTTFLILIIFPLYYRQLSLNGERSNVFGAIFFVSITVTLFFLTVTIIAGIICKWRIRYYQTPIPWKKLIIISTSFGVSGILCTISCYQRVPCHLQDPLKGAALVFSLIFYFFFCKKVMGLQRIFSATTAVVGLFISVDYGLCDEFRCRGTDISSAATPSIGWQGRAVWTLFYVAGISLWSLHISLLEGHIVTLPGQKFGSNIPTNLLSTVSRIVSNSEPLLPGATPIKQSLKRKPSPLHLVTWIHSLSFIIIVLLGWIDIFPASGSVRSFSRHWYDTENSFRCHFNIQNQVPDVKSNQETLELLSNLTPGSIIYNKTVQNLRRNKRSNQILAEITHNNNIKMKYFHKKINSYKTHDHDNDGNDDNDVFIIPKFINDTENSSMNKSLHNKNVFWTKHKIENTHHGNNSQHSKVNTEKHHNWHKLKALTNNKYKFNKTIVLDSSSANNQTPTKISHLILKTKITGDCSRLQLYSLIFITTYVLFAFSLIKFLIITESAVFTVAVITAALPLVGIIWSIIEMTIDQQIATLVWSPEISGELICSLLGTPIVFLGLGLLCRAHFFENFFIPRINRTQYSILSGGRTT